MLLRLHSPRVLSRFLCSVGTVLPLLAQGCVTEPIGEEVGTYEVTMELESNTCGTGAVILKDGHRYTAQLRTEGESGFWRIPGQKPLPGSYGEGRFQFAYSSVVARSEPDAGSFCQLVQEEVLEGAVADVVPEFDAGPTDAATAKSAGDTDEDEDKDEEKASFERPKQGLVGRHVFNIKAAAGTDCTKALSPEGAFERLPCAVSYDLKGTDTKSF